MVKYYETLGPDSPDPYGGNRIAVRLADGTAHEFTRAHYGVEGGVLRVSEPIPGTGGPSVVDIGYGPMNVNHAPKWRTSRVYGPATWLYVDHLDTKEDQ